MHPRGHSVLRTRRNRNARVLVLGHEMGHVGQKKPWPVDTMPTSFDAGPRFQSKEVRVPKKGPWLQVRYHLMV